MKRLSGLTRREMLGRTVLVSTFLLLPVGCGGSLSSTADSKGDLYDQFFTHKDHAIELGQVYLKLTPADAVLSRVQEEMNTLLEADKHSDIQSFRTHVQALIRDDFSKGRTVILNGWVLAKTEAQLCGLIALRAS